MLLTVKRCQAKTTLPADFLYGIYSNSRYQCYCYCIKTNSPCHLYFLADEWNPRYLEQGVRVSKIKSYVKLSTIETYASPIITFFRTTELEKKPFAEHKAIQSYCRRFPGLNFQTGNNKIKMYGIHNCNSKKVATVFGRKYNVILQKRDCSRESNFSERKARLSKHNIGPGLEMEKPHLQTICPTLVKAISRDWQCSVPSTLREND